MGLGPLLADSPTHRTQHMAAVPINCPNVQTSFVMRITKIEANHFANRILISNVACC